MKGGSLDDIVYEAGIIDVINTGSSMQDSIHCDYNYTPLLNGIVQNSPPPAATLDIANQNFSSIPYYAPGAEVTIQDGCPAGCTAASNQVRTYIKCGGGGNWGSVYTRSCAC